MKLIPHIWQQHPRWRALAGFGRHSDGRRFLAGMVIAVTCAASLAINHQPPEGVVPIPLALLACGVSFLVWLVAAVLRLRSRSLSAAWQTKMTALDVSVIGLALAAGGADGMFLFVLLPWIVLDDGLRLGRRALLTAAALGATGFVSAVALTPAWRDRPALALAVLALLLLVVAYGWISRKRYERTARRVRRAQSTAGRLLAHVGGEMRHSLEAALRSLELLAARRRLKSDDHGSLETARGSIKDSLRQIDNVIAYGQVESEDMHSKPADFDLYDTLCTVVRQVHAAALDKSLHLLLRIDPSTPTDVTGDPLRLTEVLTHLLYGAIARCERGQIVLEVRVARAPFVRLNVYDNGAPLAATDLNRLLDLADAGEVARPSLTQQLSLALCARIARQLGGHLSVISGRGNRFTLDIPLEPVATTDSALTGGRVLLVSDDAVLRERSKALAHALGVTFVDAPTTADAIGLLARAIRINSRIHAVLIDMPAVFTAEQVHLGADFVQKAMLSLTPVYLVTGQAPPDNMLREHGYAGTLPPDFSADRLAQALRSGGVQRVERETGVIQIEPWAWGRGTPQRARLLIADDNRTNLMILRKILEGAGYEVDTAEDGEQALTMMLSDRYKAAILDKHMPKRDGTSVIKLFRAQRRHANVPIVVLTANATVDAKVESADAGANAYLAKPATASDILGILERLLGETEIYDLARNQASAANVTVPILDTDIIAELDRLYSDPAGLAQIVCEFETEGRRLLTAMAGAVRDRDLAGFHDLLHALSGNGANVGAMRLTQACHEIADVDLIEFRRDGEMQLKRLQDEFAAAAEALHTLTTVGEPTQHLDRP